MTIEVEKDRTVKWNFYRKAYRKARWRKLGQRCLNDFYRFAKERQWDEVSGLIVVV